VRVLVTGANGFIGSRVVAALGDAGHEPVCAVRKVTASKADAVVICDFARDVNPQVWIPRLIGIDAVVNCAGILRETRADKFQTIHVDAPLALFRACAAAGVRRVIQISALGEPGDGEFIASKHRADQALAELDLDWLVLRPGLVYSAHGAYGGTSLLRALAALPGVQLLPADGMQKLRPLAAEDLAASVVAALARLQLRAEVLEVVGPEILTLRDYLLAWRGWFGLSTARVLTTPQSMVDATVALGEAWGRGPICRVIAHLLERDRLGSAQALERMQSMLGVMPTTLTQALLRRPCQAQDLWVARWYILRPLPICTLALVWIASGLVGLLLPDAAAQTALPNWSPTLVRGMAHASGVADLVLGLMLLLGQRVRTVLILMLAMVVGYTLVIGMLAPEHWFDPLGGLLKNLPIAALLIMLLALEPRGR
jgi:uncharacterized protein YbjT (DUF2867 family)